MLIKGERESESVNRIGFAADIWLWGGFAWAKSVLSIDRATPEAQNEEGDANTTHTATNSHSGAPRFPHSAYNNIVVYETLYSNLLLFISA